MRREACYLATCLRVVLDESKLVLDFLLHPPPSFFLPLPIRFVSSPQLWRSRVWEYVDGIVGQYPLSGCTCQYRSLGC